MWSFYVIALIPVLAGAALWLGSRRITFAEWMKGAVLGFVTAGCFHACTVATLTLDYKTISGHAIGVAHCPECTVESGDETEYLPEHWIAIFDFGDRRQSFEIGEAEFDRLRELFGGAPRAARPQHIEPVDDDYRISVIDNTSDVRIPGFSLALSSKSPLSGPSVMAFDDPPETAAVHPYPTGLSEEEVVVLVAADAAADLANARPAYPEELPLNWRRSRRLLGGAAEDFSIAAWDELNADLYPAVGVNLIAIGFDGDSTAAHYQEAAWRGGKRNDLVLCYGPARSDGTPQWTYCFGWSDDELVRRNLETLLLQSPPSDALLPAIRSEVLERYRAKEWPEVDVLQIPAPSGALTRLILWMGALQGGYWLIALFNRTRRAAADDRERAEVKAEQLAQRAATRERADMERIRRDLPSVDPQDPRALRQVIVDDGDAYVACFALRRLANAEVATGMTIGVTADRFRAREVASRWLDENVPDPGASEPVRAAAPLLIPRLRHKNPTTRSEARRVLDAIDARWFEVFPDARETRESLLAEFDRSVTAGTRDRTLEDALGAHGPRTFDALAARGDEPDSLRSVLPVLGATGDPRALPRIAESLESSHAGVRVAALEALARFGAGKAGAAEAERLWAALDRLRVSLDPDETHTRVLVIDALASLRDARAVPPLLALVGDAKRELRVAAIRALGEIGHESAVDPLLRRAADASDDERLALVRAAGMIGHKSIVSPLLRLFDAHRDGGSLLLETILHALFPLGGPAVEALLEREATDPLSAVDDLAILRLQQLRRGFRPPGWDLTATAWRNRLGDGSISGQALDEPLARRGGRD